MSRHGFERQPWQLGRRPAIDGLRALAIISVIGVHVSTILVTSLYGKWFAGGRLGVNIFFVISGFLITALLLEERSRSGRIALDSFWKRRALRLFPALYLLLLVQFLYTLRKHDSIPTTLKGDGLIIGYVSNWAWVYNWPQPFGLGNTWSLGVEEQFYVVWPVLLIVLLKFKQKWAVPVVALAIGVASTAYRWHLQDTKAYWIKPIAETWVELDSLMAGVLLAWALHAGWRPNRLLVNILSLPAIWYLVRTIKVYSAFPSFFGHRTEFHHESQTLLALATGILILAALEPLGPVRWVLMFPPLRWLGRLSYSLYLWHEFVFYAVLRSHRFPDALTRGVVAIGGSLILATLSFYLVERPFVRLAHRRRKPQVDRPQTPAPEPVKV